PVRLCRSRGSVGAARVRRLLWALLLWSAAGMARAAAQERSSAIRSSRAVSGGAPCIAWFSETDWLRETELTVDTLREGVAGLTGRSGAARFPRSWPASGSR